VNFLFRALEPFGLKATDPEREYEILIGVIAKMSDILGYFPIKLFS
jgi:hypothetical protein